jgi:hypothetical protein
MIARRIKEISKKMADYKIGTTCGATGVARISISPELNPEFLEGITQELPAIRPAAVVAEQDPETGEHSTVIVVDPTSYAEGSMSEVATHLTGNVAGVLCQKFGQEVSIHQVPTS